MEACIYDLRRWMINNGKTEMVPIGTNQLLEKVRTNKLSVGHCNITVSNLDKNLGTWFDSNLSMSAHVNNICKSLFYYRHNIAQIRKFLVQDSTEKLIHAIFCSTVYWNSNCNWKNSMCLECSSEICALCHQVVILHWLPIKFRVHFKIILLTFKVIYRLVPKYICDLVTTKPKSNYTLLLMSPAKRLYQP